VPNRILKAYGRLTSPSASRTQAGVQLQTVRLTTGSIAATPATGSVTVTWPKPFRDTNYTVVATVEDATAGLGLAVEHVVSKSTTGCVVRVKNNSAGALTGVLGLVAVGD
jgi:hypothetical protein